MTNTDTEKTFEDLLEVNPCVGCPAPCCRMLLSPHVPPRTLKEVDHMRFVLLFHKIGKCIRDSFVLMGAR